jgi:RNA polymerase sigma factor (sigma-70 family)
MLAARWGWVYIIRYMHLTPVSLLERLCKPNEAAAWDRFVELYSPLLLEWARKIGRQDSDAADLVQDVFLLLFRKLPAFEYDPQRSFHGWLRRVFVNQHRLRLRAHADLPLELALEVEGPLLEDSTDDRQYLAQRALRLIERDFSPTLWRAFHQYAIEGRSPDEIALELGISRGTIYSIKSKVINRLRREFAHLLD